MASFGLFLILAVLAAESLFLFLAEAIRSSQFQFQGPVFSRNGEKEKNRGGLSKPLPLFREAPEFRNGIECPKDQVTGLIPSAFPSSASSSCDTSAVHIAMTLDAHYLRGSMAAVLSVLQHASCPENVFFHFVIAEQDLSSLETVVKSTFPYLRFSAYPFEESRVKNLISESVRIALENPLNYARSYLAEILPECVQRVIYLDSDLIVIDDIAKLWNIDLGSKPIGAPEYCHAKFSKYFTGTFWSDENLSKTFQMRNPCYFNTGVMVIDLVKWRQNNYRQMIEQWMGVQRERRIYELGSLPPFLLVFAGEVKPVQHRWNQHGLGGDNISGRCRPLHPGPVSLLHWSGKGKPWLRLDSNKPCPMDALWAPYDLFVSANSQSSR